MDVEEEGGMDGWGMKQQWGTEKPEDKLVLIVDDDEAVWDILYFVVRKEGFRVEKATDGEEAMVKAGLLHPDLIVLDLMLPKAGGYEVLRGLQTDHTANIPIVIVSGRRLDHTTRDILKTEPNVKEFLEKPVSPNTLRAVLHGILKTKPGGQGDER